MLQAMWPLVALKFRWQLGRDDGEGQGREAASQRGTCRHRHQHGHWLPGPRWLGQPQARSQPWGDGAAEVLRSDLGQGEDGGRILHPSLVAPAGCHGDPGAGASLQQDFCREGERWFVLLGGGDLRAEQPHEPGANYPSSPSLHGEPFHQYSHCKWSLGSGFLLGECPFSTQGMPGVAGLGMGLRPAPASPCPG